MFGHASSFNQNIGGWRVEQVTKMHSMYSGASSLNQDIGGWRDEFTRMTGATPKTFPFILVGNKIESDIQKPRQVWEDDVRDWCAREGGVLPFVETSFSGDPQDAYKYAARVFGVVSFFSATR